MKERLIIAGCVLLFIAMSSFGAWYQYYRWNECRAHHPFFYCFMEMRR